MRVLVSYPAPRATTNPYITQLDRALRAEPGLEIVHFSWSEALRGDYDVFHVHWPDALLSASGPLKRARKRVLARALTTRLRRQGIPVVRTRHNVIAHEGSATSGRFEKALDELSPVSIHLSAALAGPGDTVVPHGHYRDWYPSASRVAATPGALVFVGHIRPYKGVERLLDAFEDLSRSDAVTTLTIAGLPRTPELAASLAERASGIDRLTTRFAYVDDDEFTRTVTRGSLVVLPYRAIGNSGAALAALSLDRPVLAPRAATTEELQAEVGEDWVVLFDGDLDADDLSRALERTTLTQGSPVFDESRGWSAAGARHEAAYREAVSAGPHPAPGSRPATSSPETTTPRRDQPVRVTIAIPTFHRPGGLRAAVDTVAAQIPALRPGLAEVTILVIDNDPAGSARETVKDDDVVYVVEPHPGIAAVRNRALAETTDQDALIFIDDDEEPTEGWLSALLERFVESGADAVAGRVLTPLPDDAPEWIKVSGAFDRPIREDGERMSEAATNNLILDLHAVRRSGLVFDERFGLTGGSDSLFTRQFAASGARIIWAEDAVVIEREDPSRFTRAWILKRVFRFGNSVARVTIAMAPAGPKRLLARGRILIAGVLRLVGGVIRFAVGVVTRSLARRGRGERTMARGRGMIAGAFGHAHNEYGLRRKAMAEAAG